MHKTLSAVVVVALTVGGAACGGGGHPSGGIPNADIYDITPGASVIIGANGVAGYGITANLGGVYRLVWNGDQATSGAYRHFYGSVWSSGAFATVVPGCYNNDCPVESNDYINAPVAVSGGQRVDFDAQTANGIDGFDFQGQEPIYFDLLIDDQRYPSLVFFPSAAYGGSTASVQSIPFGMTGT